MKEIPCKQCIIQPACTEACNALFSYGTTVDRKMHHHDIEEDEHRHYKKQYQEYLKYHRYIFHRTWPEQFKEET